MVSLVAALARDHVNANSTVLPNYELDLHGTDGQCTADVVMKAFIGIITNKEFKSKIVGILGELYHLLSCPFRLTSNITSCLFLVCIAKETHR